MNSSTPIQIPGELINGFPDALKSQVEVILTEARRKFREKKPNTGYVMNILEAADYLLERMTPLFSGAVKAGDVDADTALCCVRGFFDLLIEHNPRYHDWAERESLKQQVGTLGEWLKFTQEIAKADDTRRRAQASNGVPPEASAEGSRVSTHPLDSDPEVAKRRAIVRQNPEMPAQRLCLMFDAQHVPVPSSWFSMKWAEAYKNEKYRKRIQVIISKDKKGHG